MNDFFSSVFDPIDILDFIENKLLNNVIISVLNYLENFEELDFN